MFTEDCLNWRGLLRYLMEFENSIMDTTKYSLFEDMQQPITDYFINTSHNTYLTGNQMTSASDVDMYKYVLLSGVRCIELDCHDDEMKGDPVVTNKRTLCTKIPLVDVLKAINESAFRLNPYPVFLFVENYCKFVTFYLKILFAFQ